MEVDNEGGFKGGFGGEVVGGASGELVVAAEAEGAGTAGELVQAEGVKWVEGVAGVDWFGGGDRAASGGAAKGGCGRDGGGRDAEAVADEENELDVGEEGVGGDTEAEEEGG